MRGLLRALVARYVMPDTRYAQLLAHLEAIGRAEHEHGRIL